MKKIILIIIFISLVFSQNNLTPVKVWETGDSLLTCESVCYDKINNCIYVACINGKSFEKDGNGFISKLSVSGEIIKYKFTDNLDAPKGMVIIKNKLFVNDITNLCEIDLKTGKILTKYPVPDAGFLNDITSDTKNNLYLTDTKSNLIYKFSNGKAVKLNFTEEIKSPNGILFTDNKIFFGNSGKKEIYSFDPAGIKLTKIVNTPTGIDGLKKYELNSFIISDWNGRTYIIDIKGTLLEILNTTKDEINSADLEYIPELKLLIIPTFNSNKVVAYKIE